MSLDVRRQTEDRGNRVLAVEACIVQLPVIDIKQRVALTAQYSERVRCRAVDTPARTAHSPVGTHTDVQSTVETPCSTSLGAIIRI